MKKRNKTLSQFLVLALGFVCFILMSGFSAPSDKQIDTLHKKAINIEKYYSQYITADKNIKIYAKLDKKMKPIGVLMAQAVIELDEQAKQKSKQAYFKIKNKNLFVRYDDIKKADVMNIEDMPSAYLSFPQVIQTKHTFTLYNEQDQPQFSLQQFQIYPVFVQEEQRYGINYGGKLYYIHKRDVASSFTLENFNQVPCSTSVPVLMYHFFYDASKGEVPQDSNFTEVGTFREQLQYLKDNDYTTLTMKDVDRFMDQKVRLKANVVALTMDDGSPTVYANAFPIVKEFNMHATAFLVTGWNQGKDVESYAEMAANGIELQSHSNLMHQSGCSGMGHGGRLMCVDDATGIQDTQESFAKVGDGFVYCYPFGDVNEHGKQLIRSAGAKLAFTTKYGKIVPGMDKLELPRVRISGGISIENYAARLK